MPELREGYTTGTCAAIASKAAVRMLLTKDIAETEEIITPAGKTVSVNVLNAELSGDYAKCAVKKYAGDDPDVTDGLLIYAEVRLRQDTSVNIDGGNGVGRVTKPGLKQKPGEAAINPVPRRMIEEAVREAMEECHFEGGADIVISVPGGAEIAEKTFNPRLGIEGGISILGSSGIVKPMSEAAIIETIKTEIDVKKASGNELLILTPGNYGRDFIKESMSLNLDDAATCSNYIGEALDYAYKSGFRQLLIVGHIGKLVKCAGGIMNTHSKNSDCRMELIAAAAALHTEDMALIRKILDCITTDEAVSILEEAGLSEKVMQELGKKALYYIRNRLGDKGMLLGIVMFSNEHGILYQNIPEA